MEKYVPDIQPQMWRQHLLGSFPDRWKGRLSSINKNIAPRLVRMMRHAVVDCPEAIQVPTESLSALN